MSTRHTQTLECESEGSYGIVTEISLKKQNKTKKPEQAFISSALLSYPCLNRVLAAFKECICAW